MTQTEIFSSLLHTMLSTLPSMVNYRKGTFSFSLSDFAKNVDRCDILLVANMENGHIDLTITQYFMGLLVQKKTLSDVGVKALYLLEVLHRLHVPMSLNIYLKGMTQTGDKNLKLQDVLQNFLSCPENRALASLLSRRS